MTDLPPMLAPAYVRVMAAYNAEMNRRLYAAAERIGEAQRKADGGAFWKSVHGTFNHILWADRVWLARFKGEPAPPAPLNGSDALIDGFEDLKAARLQADAAIEAWAAVVTEDWLAGTVTWFSRVANRDMTAPASLLAAHLFNHQTHHRGQAHALITRAGEDTGATDMPFVLGAETIAEAMKA